MELYKSLYENTKNIISELESEKQYNVISFQLPYQSTINDIKKDIEFDLSKFPPQLQHMIHMFVKMHYEYLSYETLRK